MIMKNSVLVITSAIVLTAITELQE